MPRPSNLVNELLAESIVWDNVWPFEPGCGNDFASLKARAQHGVNVVSITIAGDRHNISEAMQRTAAARRAVKSEPQSFRLVESIDDIHSAKREGRIGVILHFEGTLCFERNLDVIEAFYKLGIRHTLLAFNQATSVGGGCTEPEDGGLTLFGRRVVQEMQRVGMVVDLSHTGYRTSLDTMAVATKPCIFSHSNAFARQPHDRNVRDDQIRACAATGGVIGVSGSSDYLGDGECRTETILEHVDHIAALVGPEHVALGLDLVNNAEAVNEHCRARPDEWPFAADPNWLGFRYAQEHQIGELVELMVQHDYSVGAIQGILGGNWMRVCREAWQ